MRAARESTPARADVPAFTAWRGILSLVALFRLRSGAHHLPFAQQRVLGRNISDEFAAHRAGCITARFGACLVRSQGAIAIGAFTSQSRKATKSAALSKPISAAPHGTNADRASFARLQQAFLTKCGHGSGRCSRSSRWCKLRSTIFRGLSFAGVRASSRSEDCSRCAKLLILMIVLPIVRSPHQATGLQSRTVLSPAGNRGDYRSGRLCARLLFCGFAKSYPGPSAIFVDGLEALLQTSS